MKPTLKLIAGSLLATALIASPPSLAATPAFGITTGAEKGTYYEIGRNLGAIAGKAGIGLRLLESEGSLQNMYRVYKSPEAQLGIVQHDVLFWIRAHQDSRTAQRMAEKIKLIVPLYKEEVHIVARTDANIETFEDLAGKIVAIGSEGSGTSVTAGVLFRLADIRPAEQVSVGASEALHRLKQGSLDAMVYVVGAPAALFVEDIAPADNLNFVAIDNKSISEFYGAPEMLDASDYAWAKDGVSTVAVTAALITYDYRTNRQKCDYVGRITNLIHDGIGELRSTGHAKWRSVDLDATVAGWDTSACASEALHKRGNIPGGSADPAFRNFLDEMKQPEQ